MKTPDACECPPERISDPPELVPANRIAQAATDSELAEQTPESLDAIIDAAAPQCVPDDRLMRRHHIDPEFALERVDRFRRRPMWRRQQDRVGSGMLA